MANLVFYIPVNQPMNDPSFTYLENRAEFYSTLFPRIVSEKFAAEFEKAILPLRESNELLQKLQSAGGVGDSTADMDALMLDDLLKKPGVGQQLAKTTTSVRETLKNSERIEMIGYTWFEVLSKQELKNQIGLSALASSRLSCLTNILRLRDEMDFHRLRLL